MRPALLKAHRRGMNRQMARVGTRPFSALPCVDSGCFAEDVQWMLGRLAATGHDRVVVIDLTKPEFAIPVFRVIIPGMLHGPRSGERPTRTGEPA